MCACVRVCVRACVRACVPVYTWVMCACVCICDGAECLVIVYGVHTITKTCVYVCVHAGGCVRYVRGRELARLPVGGHEWS